MKSTQFNQLKAEEERKRAAAYDPAQRWQHIQQTITWAWQRHPAAHGKGKRWQHIQQTITWAEANLPPHLRRNRPRTRGPEERRQP